MKTKSSKRLTDARSKRRKITTRVQITLKEKVAKRNRQVKGNGVSTENPFGEF